MISETLDKMKNVADFLEQKLAHVDPKNVLCCFDIDQTIFVSDHPGTYSKNIEKYQSEIDELKSKYKDFSYARFSIHQNCEDIIFDDTFCEAFSRMPYRKIALTAAMTGEFDTIKRIEVFRYERLKDKNIIFDDPLFADKDIVLDNLPSYMGYYPVCYKGVLCSNGENTTTNKGSALCGLLKKVNFVPEYVIQVDDKQLNLDFIDEELSKQFPNTQFIGILYKGAKDYCPQDISREDFIDFWVDNYKRIKNFRPEFIEHS